MNKVSFKIGIVVFASLISVLFCWCPTFACTGVYVGSQASQDGTSIIARSNDMHPLSEPCYIKVYGGADGEKLEKITSENGFEYELPKDIHRFITLPTSEYVDSYAYITSAINDCGVSISATLTGYCGRESLQYNPHVEGGIVEDMFPAIVGACASSAREGIELIAKIIDEKGSGEDNIIMISDQKECWYMEIYAGHQYCAVRAPEDCVCALGNEFMLETVDKDNPDVIYSKELFSLPEQHGFANYDADGKMNLFNTYVGKNNFTDYSHLRTWEGHRRFSPSTAGEYSNQVKYPLFYKPDNKVSLQNVMDFFRDRYQGTRFYLDKNNHQYRPIATESQVRTHILQTYKDVPAHMACCQWLSWSNAEFSTYFPISNLQSQFDPSYTYNINSYDFDEQNAYTNFKTLNTLCDQKRDQVGPQIQSYWKLFENYEQKAFAQVIEKIKDSSQSNVKAQSTINDFCTSTESQANYDAKRLCKDVVWYMNNTEETFNQKLSNLKKGDMAFIPQKYDKFKCTFDVELAAKLLNWNVEKLCIQDHNPDMPEYDNNKIGDVEQADNGGKEGFIKISSNSHTIELHTNNGHRLSTGKIIIDGNENPCCAYLQDGKIYADVEIANQLIELSQDNEISVLDKAMISPSRNLNTPLNSFFNFFNSLFTK